MVKKIFSLLLLLALCFGAYWFLFLRDNEELRVRKKIADLCELASKPEKSNPAMQLLRTQSLPKLFADPCTLAFGFAGIQGSFSPQQLAADIVRVNQLLTMSKFSADIINVELLSPAEAEVEFTGRFQGTLKSGEVIDEVRELIATLKKNDSTWVIDSVKFNKILTPVTPDMQTVQ